MFFFFFNFNTVLLGNLCKPAYILIHMVCRRNGFEIRDIMLHCNIIYRSTLSCLEMEHELIGLQTFKNVLIGGSAEMSDLYVLSDL